MTRAPNLKEPRSAPKDRTRPLTSLADVSLTLTPVEHSILCLDAGRVFHTAIFVSNEETASIAWDDNRPLNIGYRWINAAGDIIERDGERTTLPGPLSGGSRITVEIAGEAPTDEGDFDLLVSLVLEDVHWACDVSPNGWVVLPARTSLADAWPLELTSSPGAKALRGALLAAELARAVADRPLNLTNLDAPSNVASDSSSASQIRSVDESAKPGHKTWPSNKRAGLARRLRAWLRHLLGIPEMRSAIEELLRRSAIQHNGLIEVAEMSARIEPFRQLTVDHLATVDQKLASFEADSRRSANSLKKLFEVSVRSAQIDIMRQELADCVAAVDARFALLEKQAKQSVLEQRAATDRTMAALGSLTPLARHANKLKQIADIHEAMERLPGRIEGEIEKTRAHIDSRLERSPAVVELISMLRQLAEWAHSVGDPTLIRSIHAAVQQLPTHIETTASQQVPRLDQLYLHASTTSTKLDALMARQLINVPGSGLVLSRNRFGFLAIQDDDVHAIAYYSTSELPERGTVEILERLLKPGDLFLDVGANVGSFSLVAGRLVGPTGKVIAVEPVPATARMLRTTVLINGISNVVEVQECALGNTTGRAPVFAGVTSGHSSMLPQDGEPIEVDVERGSIILGERLPRLIKIDVEGWELEVVEGLRPTLEASDDIVVIVECSPTHIRRKGLSPDEWLARIRATGKTIWLIEDEPIGLRELVDINQVKDASANLLLARDLPTDLGSLAQ